MPCLYAHTLFGLSVRDRLPQPLATLLARNEAAFLAGLPGPDIYFFDRFPPPPFRPHEKRTGNALHDAPADALFAPLKEITAELFLRRLYKRKENVDHRRMFFHVTAHE